MSIPTVINPVVGQDYDVPCVEVTGVGGGTVYVPVSCDFHADPEIEVNDLHWHTDWRFAGEEVWDTVAYSGLRAKLTADGYMEAPAAAHRYHADRPVVVRKMRCLRTAPARSKPAYLQVLKDKYRGCKVDRDCPTCPHRGVALEVNHGKETAICQGHGLAWNMTTGEMSGTR